MLRCDSGLEPGEPRSMIQAQRSRHLPPFDARRRRAPQGEGLNGENHVLLQIAFDKPEHLSLLSLVKPYADIVEIGTPLLKRFGVSAITTARELCPDVMVL